MHQTSNMQPPHHHAIPMVEGGQRNFKPPHQMSVVVARGPEEPGPGHYRTNSTIGCHNGQHPTMTSIAISSSFKQPSCRWNSFQPSPGPTAYNNNSIEVLKETNPSYSMRMKPTQEISYGPISISHGPAEYGRLTDPVPNIQTAPWREPTKRKVQRQVYSQPGPGDYLSAKARDALGVRNPTYKLGLKTNDLGAIAGRDGPGPANYGVENYMGQGMAKSISAKDLVISDRNTAKESITPGPGAYLQHSSSTPILKRAPSYSMASGGGSGRRGGIRIMGNAKVGPGKYNAGVSHLNRSASYTMPGRSQIKPWAKKTKTPGPNFMPKEKPRQEYSMQGKNDYHVRTSEIYKNPGPGQYNDHEAWNSSKHTKRYDRAKGKTMGARLPMKTSLDPRKMGLTHDAPNADVSKSLKAPSYSMVGRQKQKQIAVMPGPGHYTIKPQMFNQQKIKRLC